MALRWARVKLGPFKTDDEWEKAIRALAEVIDRLERSHDIIRYYFLNHGAPAAASDIMMNFYGDPWKLLAELRAAGWGEWIMPNMPESFDPTEEKYRFDDDYLVGIALFELGSRLAIANRLDRPLMETNEGVTQSIFYAFRHSFSSGMLSLDQRFMEDLDPALGQLHGFFTTHHATSLG
jgi:hypothetical protein